jgi:Ca2+-transporting ATPase
MKAMSFLLAVHVPIAGLSLLPALLGWPLVLLPAHIVFLEFLIDPACSVVFEAEPPEPDLMRRPPRDPKAPFFRRGMIALSLARGFGILLVVLAVFAAALLRGQGEAEVRALTFATLILADLGLIFGVRARSRALGRSLLARNAALWWLSGGALAGLAAVLYIPFLRELFRFSALHPDDLAVCLGAGVLSVLWFEALRAFRRRGVRDPFAG